MSSAWDYYLTSVLVFFAIDTSAGLALNLQFGIAGIYNFGFVVFQAIGAYVAGVTTIGPPVPGLQESYILGARLPFPIPWLAGAAAAALVSLPVGLACLRRLRGDYQAMVLLVFALLATTVATDATGLFNGASGIYGIPQPFVSLGLSRAGYNWAYFGVAALIAFVVYLGAQRISFSPLGRVLRSIRDNESAAAAVGIGVYRARVKVFVLGGAVAGLSGAVMVSYIGAWSPGSWAYAETFVLLSALVVGGSGNNNGAVLGTFLLPVLVTQVIGLIPLSTADVDVVSSLEWVLIAAVTLFCLWLWPQGALPDSRRIRKILLPARSAVTGEPQS